MILLYISVFCDRCSEKIMSLGIDCIREQGWSLNKRTGECLCPICIWEQDKSKIPPTRHFRTEDKLQEKFRLSHFERLKESKILLSDIENLNKKNHLMKKEK